jgi:hypothetical protein
MLPKLISDINLETFWSYIYFEIEINFSSFADY